MGDVSAFGLAVTILISALVIKDGLARVAQALTLLAQIDELKTALENRPNEEVAPSHNAGEGK